MVQLQVYAASSHSALVIRTEGFMVVEVHGWLVPTLVQGTRVTGHGEITCCPLHSPRITCLSLRLEPKTSAHAFRTCARRT